MNGYARIAGLSVALALAGCSHEPAKSAEVTQAQVGAEAGTADLYRVRPPPADTQAPANDVFQGARYYECTDGERFTINRQTGPNPGVTVVMGEDSFWMPEVARGQFSGSYGELTVTSPSQTSLQLAGEELLRSCVRAPMAPG